MKIKKERILVYITNHLFSRIMFSRMRLFWYRRIMKFELGVYSSILTDCKISTINKIKIGDHTVINNSCRFDNRFPIAIGNNVSITYGTVILTKGHDIDDPQFRIKGAGVNIDDYVWICANTIILPGIQVGKGAVNLTGSVVTEDVALFNVVGRNPAKYIRKRSEDLRYQLFWDPWVPFFG